MARARDLGIPFSGDPGRFNAITDVKGVEVGHSTIIHGDGKLVIGKGPIRTGVTAIHPQGKTADPVFGAYFSLNGNGEVTGCHWLEESGLLIHPILITNTLSVGSVHEGFIKWLRKNHYYGTIPTGSLWGALPVVAETFDGRLNDIAGLHVKDKHVFQALDEAKSGPVAEGNIGGGTGMICHQFKGGIGTSSRVTAIEGTDYTVGVLVQANYGMRKTLRIAGVPVGEEITDLMPVFNSGFQYAESGSIIIVIATDAPLIPSQLKRMAKRAALGLGLVGSIAGNGSGDIFLAFSTGNTGFISEKQPYTLKALAIDLMDNLFLAAVQATEEAIVNAMVAAETMVGINDNTVHALPHDRVTALMKKYKRYQKTA